MGMPITWKISAHHLRRFYSSFSFDRLSSMNCLASSLELKFLLNSHNNKRWEHSSTI